MLKTKRNQILGLIGNTPMIRIRENVFAKLEAVNPSGSIKDRMALYMFETAEKRDEIRQGYNIVEATSGNTGIAFAMIASLKGYEFTAIMPETMSSERKQIMQAFGANLIITQTMDDAVKKLEEFAARERVWLPRQFDNETNVDCHRETTGNEILQQLNDVDAFVAGVGTGGTLMGVAQALRSKHPNVKIVAVEPEESAVLSGGKAGEHKIQGIGSGFVPSIVDLKEIDEVLKVRSNDAMQMARHLAKENGLFVGISSGANVLASLRVAKKMRNGNVATVLPDSGNRYLSMGLYSGY